jgi:hypothetical protein
MTTIQQDSSDPVMQQLYKRELEPNLDSLPRNKSEGFIKLCADPKYTFFEADVYYKHLKSHNIIHCDAIEVPGAKTEKSFSMALRKGSPYLKFLNSKLVCLDTKSL